MRELPFFPPFPVTFTGGTGATSSASGVMTSIKQFAIRLIDPCTRNLRWRASRYDGLC
ncbi:MAG TPA: hypothetical protein VG204_14520 [Terriglobia bacterium]|nr:hypothetical protein [Terriglobia bacterium]